MSRLIDLTGQQFEKLIVIERAKNDNSGKAQWLCQCECGNTRVVSGRYLRIGKIKACNDCSKKLNNFLDLTNQKFGRLTVLEPTDKRAGSSVIWKCQCECGNICYKSSHSLRQNKAKSCGCLQKESRHQPWKDLTGQQFGRLTVIEKTNESNYEGVLWKCKCECGNEKIVSGYSLTHERVQSCGCLNSIMNSKIQQILIELNIDFETEKIFKNCKDNKTLRFDFYLPKYNLCIEYDGEQHFKPVKYWGGEEGLQNRQNKDQIKTNFCLENNINLIRINYVDKEKINKDYILNIIKKG